VAEWFTDRREAEATLRAVLIDEPEWIDVLRIAEFDLMRPGIVLSASLN
jgi:hypothetical protein